MNLIEMFEEDLNKESEGGNERPGYTKFAEGNTFITILAVTASRWAHFMLKAGKLTVNCPGKDCPVCNIIKATKKAGGKTDHKSVKKFGMLIFNHNSGVIEILDQRTTFVKNFQKMLKDLREDYIDKAMEADETLSFEDAETLIDSTPELYDPSAFTTRVSREGLGQSDTKYTFKKAPKKDQQDVPEEALVAAKEMDLDSMFITLTSPQLLELLGGKTLKEIFKPEEDADGTDTEIKVNFDK